MAIGSAAVGATAENKDVFGLVLLLTVIPATIVIFGLVVVSCCCSKSGQTMGLEAVVEEIREKGKKEAEKIRAASQQETDKILAAAGKRDGEIKLAAEAESLKQTTHIIEQEVSAANLLVKRELLNTQKALLDKVYENVLTEIAALPESFHREAIKKLLSEAKKEISKGKISCNSRDMAVVKAVISATPEYAGFKVGNPVDIDGGILLEGEGGELQIDYSYRTFLAKVWESGLKDASDILFG